jgi:DNA-binding transcriptional MerR regulator
VSDPDPDVGVYSISVAAELSGLNVRSLRLYERHGLLRPSRTKGGTRRFSQNDLSRLHRIAELLADGVNITGIGKILDLEDDTHQLRTENTALRAGATRTGPTDDTAGREHSAQNRDPDRHRSAARHTPRHGHREQSRPG